LANPTVQPSDSIDDKKPVVGKIMGVFPATKQARLTKYENPRWKHANVRACGNTGTVQAVDDDVRYLLQPRHMIGT